MGDGAASDRLSDSQGVLTPWAPARWVKKVDPLVCKYSRGFLRSKPEKWFPALPNEWLALCASLGTEISITDVKPSMGFPEGLERGYCCLVDGEPVGLLVDSSSALTLVEAVCPKSSRAAFEVALEYLARRFVSTLALSWSSAEESTVLFDASLKTSQVRPCGSIKMSFSLNRTPCEVWIVLGEFLVSRLDGLWRRQIHSISKPTESVSEISIEIAQIAVPLANLSDYVTSGTVVDLETSLGDAVTLRHGGKVWQQGKLREVDGHIAFEILGAGASSFNQPEGSVRIGVELARCQLENTLLTELTQVEAIWATGKKLTDEVSLIVNGEVVAEGHLCQYQGRLAISVN